MAEELHPIEQELTEASEFDTDKKYKNRQDYLAALVRAVDRIDEEVFDNLSDEAADWLSNAVKAMNKKEDIEEFEDESGPEPLSDEEPALSDDEPTDDEIEGAEVEVAETSEGEEEAEEAEPAPKAKTTPKPRKKSEPTPTRADSITGELDKFGFVLGTKTSEAMAMLEQGARMKDVKEKFGDTFYTSLKKCVARGHVVTKEGSTITLTCKDDIKRKK